MLSTKQLSYALAVERTLHFRKAAEQCNISQSALSTALTEMEKQLGFQVFERDNKKVLVTPIGKEVLERAKAIMLQMDELEDLAQAQKAPLSYPIKLGVIPTIAPYLLPLILPALRREYPLFSPHIVEEQSHILVDRVRTGQLDTAILALPYPCSGLLSMEFWQEDFYWVALQSQHNKALKEVASADLEGENLMLLKEGHCLKDHILDVCKLPEQSGAQRFETASLTTLIQLVLNGMGTTLIPQMALAQLTKRHPELSTIHLHEPSPHRRIACVIRPNYTRMNSIEALIDLSKRCLSE